MSVMQVLRSLLAVVLVLSAGCAASPSATPAVSRASRASAVAPPSIIAGTSGNYPPLSVWNDGRPQGFAPLLLADFANAQHATLTWARFEWPSLVSDLKKSRFDVAADGITVRPERSVAGRFTVPIARGGAVLLLRRPAWANAGPGTDPRAALAALDRPELRVVVNRGGHLERVARELLHNATISALPDNAPVRDAFARGDADAAMTNTFEAPRWADGLGGVEQLGPLTSDITALWVRADRGDLADTLDTWLLDEEESGRLAALRATTLGPGGGGLTARPLDALVAATAERLALMPAVAAAKARTGKAVEDAAQEERVIAAGTEAVAKAATARGMAPPRRELVAAFFRAQIEAAKLVQERVTKSDTVPAFSLEDELRPAIARITARMAFLVVRLPRATTRADVSARAREDLADVRLDGEHIDRLAVAISALAADMPAR
jgi:cyclohexadienyl dehydratase